MDLTIVVRIVIDVMQDDDIRGGQVDAESAGLGGQQEDENIVILIELVDQLLSERDSHSNDGRCNDFCTSREPGLIRRIAGRCVHAVSCTPRECPASTRTA